MFWACLSYLPAGPEPSPSRIRYPNTIPQGLAATPGKVQGQERPLPEHPNTIPHTLGLGPDESTPRTPFFLARNSSIVYTRDPYAVPNATQRILDVHQPTLPAHSRRYAL